MVFLALYLLLVISGPKKSMPIKKLDSSSLVFSIFQGVGQNRTETLQLVKKNADVILYMHGRACTKILFMTAQ